MPFIPIGHDFVAEVIGLDLRTPLDAEAAAIHAAIEVVNDLNRTSAYILVPSSRIEPT
jgi:hypothetical protein